MKGIPTYACSVDTSQLLLGSSCAKVELAPNTIIDEDDDWEIFVAVWCVHPNLIPDEKFMAFLEKQVHDRGLPLFI